MTILGGVGSQKRFQRPLLPCSQTKLLLVRVHLQTYFGRNFTGGFNFLQRDQLASHEEQVAKLESSLAEHKSGSVPTKGLNLQNHREKEAYLQYEVSLRIFNQNFSDTANELKLKLSILVEAL